MGSRWHSSRLRFLGFQRIRCDLVKLFGVGAVGALHRAIDFGANVVQAALLAGLLELSGEFTAAVNRNVAGAERFELFLSAPDAEQRCCSKMELAIGRYCQGPLSRNRHRDVMPTGATNV